jgi:hypothetical protein
VGITYGRVTVIGRRKPSHERVNDGVRHSAEHAR